MTAIFLQVRLDSFRLPRKALLPLADRSVVEHAMYALNGVPADCRMLLTTEDSAPDLIPLARRAGWDVFTGPLHDVLARFVLAARQVGAKRIIRATGDNPLVSALMAGASLSLFEQTGAAYAGYAELPYGAGVEVIDAASLEQAYNESDDPYEREHVAPFLYRRPERFAIKTPPAPEAYRAPGLRVTLDTPEDYESLKKLYAGLYTGAPLDLDTVIPWLKNRNGREKS